MKRFFILCQLELKQALSCLPRILCGTVVLLAVISGIIFCGQNLLYQKPQINKARIAFVLEDDSFFVSMAIGLAGSQSASTQDTCEFIFTDAETAAEKLKQKEVIAVATIPEHFIHSIMDGTNLPIRIDFASKAGYEAIIFQEIAQAAMQILGSTQAGNYTARDFYTVYGEDGDALDDAYDRLEAAYISLALDRETIFHTETAAATGALSVTQFYLAGGCILFLLLWGIPCIRYLTRYSGCLLAQMKRSGISALAAIAARFAGLWSMFLLLSVVLLFPICLLLSLPVLPILVTLPFLLAAVCAILLFLYEISDGGIGTILLILFSAFGLCLLSGCLVPLALLPKAVTPIARLLPTTYMMNGLASAILGQFSLTDAAFMLLGGIVFFTCTVLVRRFRTR